MGARIIPPFMEKWSPSGQRSRTFRAFQYPRTMLDVARETGIERSHICWYVHDLRKAGAIYPVKRGLCPISKTRATFYTTSIAQLENHFIWITQTVWKGLDSNDTNELWRSIRTYFTNDYREGAVAIPENRKSEWERIKAIIDKDREDIR